MRLAPSTLAALGPDVVRPGYDRRALRTGIVHLGLGAFVRAHLAVATDAAMAASGDLSWGICGVSMRHDDVRAALAPQDRLYTLAVRDVDPADTTGQARQPRQPRQRLQVLGCLSEVLLASEQAAAVLERIAAADTRIVSLSVTEKGYHAQADGAADLIARGLALRRAAGLPGLTLMALDNLPGNGQVLRRLVLERAAASAPALAAWIDAQCSFPRSMVDRIVPRTTDADREAISQALGLDDAAPVLAEPFFDWAVEDRFVAGRPDWTQGGARFVADVQAWERLKLRMVNGAHSAIAYLGVMAGWRTVDEAMAQPDLARFIDGLLRDEVARSLPALPGLDLNVYRRALMQRFANPALAHRTAQIAMDGSQKLPQRWLATLQDLLHEGHRAPRLSFALAAWLHHLRGCDDAGAAIALDDPAADALRAQAAAAAAAGDTEAEVRHWLQFAPLFGATPALTRSVTFAGDLARALQSLRRQGVRAALAAV